MFARVPWSRIIHVFYCFLLSGLSGPGFQDHLDQFFSSPFESLLKTLPVHQKSKTLRGAVLAMRPATLPTSEAPET